MSSANVELVQKVLGAYLTGDEGTQREMIPPDAEVYGAPGIINAGTYHGYEGFQQWVRQWEEAWDEINYELGEMIEVGNSFVVVPAHIVGRGAGSGLEIDSVFGWMYEFQGGKAVRFHTYATVDDALEAARRLSGSE
jgi:ketosteroid isomerase-like protein